LLICYQRIAKNSGNIANADLSDEAFSDVSSHRKSLASSDRSALSAVSCDPGDVGDVGDVGVPLTPSL
jgi:hypothetical protein